MIGLIGRKLGMTQIPEEDGSMIPVTVIEAGPCIVLGIRRVDKDGYSSIKLGYGEVPKKKLSKPILGELVKALGEREVYPARVIKEFRVSNPEEFQIGQEIKVDLLKGTKKVDITGITKGRGFAGVMKRWGFSGGPMSHGSKFHRKPGSIGQTTDPGRVFKGKKMAGHYGMERVTIKNLRVVKVIPEKNLLLVKGSVPGPNGRVIYIRAR